jgi:hypothetical protein
VDDVTLHAQRLAALARGGEDWLEQLDAAWECRHGRLPTDGTPPCGCWGAEAPGAAPEPSPPQEEEPDPPPPPPDPPRPSRPRSRKGEPTADQRAVALVVDLVAIWPTHVEAQRHSGLSKSTFHRALRLAREEGLLPWPTRDRPPGPSPIPGWREAAERVVDGGERQTAVAADLGISRQTVGRWVSALRRERKG